MTVAPVPRQHGQAADLRRRFPWFVGAIAFVFLVLLGRLWQLQISQGDVFLQKSQDNFVKDVEIPALRGRIKDCRGRVLVDNRPAYNVYVTPRFFTGESMKRLQKMLALDDAATDALWTKVTSVRGLARFRGVLAAADIPRDMMALVETQKAELPGVAVEAVPHRSYPHGILAAHALGFLNEISADELIQRAQEGYRPGQFIGRAGVERAWEAFLRGKGGSQRVVVDARGQRKGDDEAKELLGGVIRDDPVPGADVVLSIDLGLQEALDKALDRLQAGAAVAVEVDTGRILAIGSRPAYDPNVLSGRLTRAEDQRLSKDPRRPRIDKVLRENYFPGSTFKVVPMLAALEDGSVDPSEKVVCGGGYRFGKRMFHCMEVHGKVDLMSALVRSCNTYFFKLGERVGMDRMAHIAGELGFGVPTGLGLNGEVPGFVPTTEFYKHTQEGFHPGSTLNMAIGQGSVKVTVLQLAMAYAAIVNGGKLWVPQIALRIEAPGSGQVIDSAPPRLRRQLALRPEALTMVRRALAGVVNDPKGTAWNARLPELPVQVGGKTGTAQVRKLKARGQSHIVQEGEWDATKDHAWFVGFAPAQKPRIVVVALVEHGGLGAKAAAPIVMQVIKGYFDSLPAHERPTEKAIAAGPPPNALVEPPDTSADDEPADPGD